MLVFFTTILCVEFALAEQLDNDNTAATITTTLPSPASLSSEDDFFWSSALGAGSLAELDDTQAVPLIEQNVLAATPSNAKSLPATLPSGSGLFLSVTVGAGWLSEFGSAENVALADIITNRYVPQQKTNWQFFSGIGVGRHVKSSGKYSVDLGLSGYYLNFGTQHGIVHPAFNLSPDFDTLNYSLKASSVIIWGELHWYFNTIFCKPYLFLGSGIVLNYAKHYVEMPTDPNETAAPMLSPFENYRAVNFSYGVGAGISHFKLARPKWTLEYRYVNLGQVELGLTPVQSTAQHLAFRPINENLIVFTLYD